MSVPMGFLQSENLPRVSALLLRRHPIFVNGCETMFTISIILTISIIQTSSQCCTYQSQSFLPAMERTNAKRSTASELASYSPQWPANCSFTSATATRLICSSVSAQSKFHRRRCALQTKRESKAWRSATRFYACDCEMASISAAELMKTTLNSQQSSAFFDYFKTILENFNVAIFAVNPRENGIFAPVFGHKRPPVWGSENLGFIARVHVRACACVRVRGRAKNALQFSKSIF